MTCSPVTFPPQQSRAAASERQPGEEGKLVARAESRVDKGRQSSGTIKKREVGFSIHLVLEGILNSITHTNRNSKRFLIVSK